jgi:TonB family protein
MYFDFEDNRPDTPSVERAISWREGVLLSIVVHVLVFGLIVFLPRWIPVSAMPLHVAKAEDPREKARFVFVQPRQELKALRPPERAEMADRDRNAQAPKRAEKPTNPLPYSRGNSPERVERAVPEPERAPPAPRAAEQDSQQAQQQESPSGTEQSANRLPDSQTAQLTLPSGRTDAPRIGGRLNNSASGPLGDALRNLQRYVQRDQFENPQGGGGQFGPAIQFDTKGVEFGPWIRRFIAQVKGNWLVPLAAMSMKGHVVLTFNVHKNGAISDLRVIQPCPVEAFNTAAYGALSASNPTQPLPPEYPSDKAFFTVTFFYNEEPQ